MGIMKHHAIVITSWSERDIKEAHTRAIQIFGGLVTNIVQSVMNGYSSFFIGPDGSKEGWDCSDSYDVKREEFYLWLKKKHELYLDVAQIVYANEAGRCSIREIK